MGIRRRLERLDRRITDSAAAHRLHHLLERMLPLVVVALVAVLYLEFFVTLNPAQYDLLIRAEQAILAYFILELAVKRGIHTDNREYLRDNWLDILLVVPFFAAVTGITRFLRSLKGFKALKGTKVAKTAKGAKTVKGTKAAKGAKALHGKKIVKASKKGKKAKKGLKAVKKGKEFLEEISEDLLKVLRD